MSAARRARVETRRRGRVAGVRQWVVVAMAVAVVAAFVAAVPHDERAGRGEPAGRVHLDPGLHRPDAADRGRVLA